MLLGLREADAALEGGHQAGVVTGVLLGFLAGCGAAAQLRCDVLLGAAPGQSGLAHGAAHRAVAGDGRGGRVFGDDTPVGGPDPGHGGGRRRPVPTGAAHGQGKGSPRPVERGASGPDAPGSCGAGAWGRGRARSTPR